MSVNKIITAAALLTTCLVPAAVLASTPWAEYQQLPMVSAYAAHGSTLAMTRTLLVVGDPGRTDLAGATHVSQAGGVTVYRWNSGWHLQNNLQLSDIGVTPVANAHFGAAVAVSGDRVLVGCPGCVAGKHVIMIDVSDTSGQAVATPLTIASSTLEVSDPDLGTGAAVALDGDLIAVGSPRTAPFSGGKKYGAVWFGHFDGTGFVKTATFFGDQDGAHYGLSLALTNVNYGGTIPASAIYLAVGAPAYVNAGTFGLAGRAYLVKKYSLRDHWDAALIFPNPNPGLADGMGLSLAYNHPPGYTDAYLAIGLPGRSISGQAGGSVRVYHAEPNKDNYDFQDELSLPDAVSGDRFGSSLALINRLALANRDDPFLLVGAPGRAVDAAPNAGSAYLYWGAQFWSFYGALPPPSAGNQAFGTSVAMFSLNGGIVGAPAYGANGQGKVYTYLCHRIFEDDFDGGDPYPCNGP